MKSCLSAPDIGYSGPASLSDIILEGMYHVSTIRSPVSKGILRSVDAQGFPRGYSLIRGGDIAGSNSVISFATEIPVLATDRLSYRGEPLALVTGPEQTIADELARGVLVRCDEEEGVFAWETFASSQVVAKRVVTIGDPDRAFACATHIDMGTYKTESIEHYYSEPMGALAFYDYDKLAVYCATQWPYHVRYSISATLGCARDEVVVHPTRLGIHLDGKLWYPSLVSCHAAIASTLTGKPVRILYTRHEDFLFTPKRSRSSVTINSAMDKNGSLSGLMIHLSVNVGAHAPLAEEILSQTVMAATGIYNCPNIRIEGYAVSTNTPTLGALGGMGSSHAFFAIEAHADRLAKRLGQNPVEWKLKNMVRKDSVFLGGAAVSESPPCDSIANRIMAESDFNRKYASYETVRMKGRDSSDLPMRGIGLALAYQGGMFFLKGDSPNSYTLEGTLDMQLRLELKTSAAVVENVILDRWRRAASELLNLPLDSVIFTPPSTDRVPNSGPMTMSRSAVIEHLVGRCCRLIQKRRFRDPLPITVRCQHRLANTLKWTAGHLSGSPFENATWGAAVVEVEIDPFTLTTKPTGVWIVVEGGSKNDSDDIADMRLAEAGLRATVIDALGSCTR
jgi:CO/xanthine dehydrogenase Mo-binding subunit